MQALVATLAGTAGVPDVRIYRSRTAALRTKSLPALLVEYAGDVDPDHLIGGIAERTMGVRISAVVTGEPADAAADPILVSVHAKVMADTRLGGLSLDIREGSTELDLDGADDGDAALVTTLYQVRYRTKAKDLTSK